MKGRRVMRATTFPESIQFKAPSGFLDSVRGAAQREGVTLSEYVRQAVRERLRDEGEQQAAEAS